MTMSNPAVFARNAAAAKWSMTSSIIARLISSITCSPRRLSSVKMPTMAEGPMGFLPPLSWLTACRPPWFSWMEAMAPPALITSATDVRAGM